MGVDFGVRMVYGFELDQEKFLEFYEQKQEENPNFDIYNWMYEEVDCQSNCEVVYENHYIDVTSLDNTVYFGIPVFNRITASGLEEIERDRYEEVCDELIRFFGSYDILGDFEAVQPELIAVGILD
jgi:hypothetical protein